MKLYFRYGTMNSSKSANLLMVAHNYKAQGRKILILKPKLDDRFGVTTIKSRAGLSCEADILVDKDTDLVLACSPIDEGLSCILVDECQFLSPNQIESLRSIAYKIPVICYGLRTDYMTRLFPASKRLMELADSIEEIKTICTHCTRKAIFNAKFKVEEGKRVYITLGSTEPDLGAEDKYENLCHNCWLKLVEM